MNITLNLATHLRGIIKLTNDRDEPVEADVSVEEESSDPVLSATLSVVPRHASPYACHILFPEVGMDVLPRSIRLDCEVLSKNTNLIIDGVDRAGSCVAMPFYRGGHWCQGQNRISLDQPYMVWKEKCERRLIPPIRLKYLLVLSTDGGPVRVRFRGLVLEFVDASRPAHCL